RTGGQMNRFRIPCRYNGDEAFRDEAILFVCGAVAATLGVPVDYSYPRVGGGEGLFHVHFFLSSAPTPAVVDRWRIVMSILPGLLMEPVAKVEIGDPELVTAKS